MGTSGGDRATAHAPARPAHTPAHASVQLAQAAGHAAEHPAGNTAMHTAVHAAVRAAPELRQQVRWRLRLLTGLAELHAEPSPSPTADPIGRGRGLAGGAALRNLELAVGSLGRRPVVRLLPDDGDPLHLATVAAGEDRDPDHTERRLHAAVPQRRCHPQPFADQPLAAPVRRRVLDAASQPGTFAVQLTGEPLRTVGTVLAAAADDLPDVQGWLAGQPARTPRADRAALIEQLGRGTLLLLATRSDRPAEWLRAGWALQNAWLTAACSGLVASVVGGVLHAPGVRAALAARLDLDGCPQLLLRVGRPQAT